MATSKFIDVLIVDDEDDICSLISGVLVDNGFEARVSHCYVEAISEIERQIPQVIVVDVWLGDSERDGLRLLQYVKETYPHVVVIMMSGHGTISTAVEAIKQGASDFIEKPFDSSRLLVSIDKAIEVSKLKKENNELKIKAKITDTVIGISPNVKEINKAIDTVAPLNGRCTILGHKNSDKEAIAKKIHKLSPRHSAPFFSINCLQCPSPQVEIELFGAEFIERDKNRINRGLFERATGGTLFIDNIDTLTLSLQAKLLATLTENKFKMVGANTRGLLQLNTRIIVGVSNDIEKRIADGTFNRELYYRVSPNKITVLPLCERTQDIPYIMQYYIDQAVKLHNLPPIGIALDVIDILKTYEWPGDMMELRNLVDWIMTSVLAKPEKVSIIRMNDLPLEMVSKELNVEKEAPFMAIVSNLGIKEAKESFEREYFKNQLQRFSGNVSQVSKFTGMERSALYRKLKNLNIRGDDN